MPGQTLSEIRQLLAAAGLAPQHRYGQNFLIDLNLMRKLLLAGEVVPGDTVLEVGPGTGSLTELLLEAGARVVAVEIDRGLTAVLRARLGAQPRLTLIQGDALADKHHINGLVLKVLAEQPPDAGGCYKLVSNLPYQIATPLLLDLLLVELRFERLAVTIQKEVGERLVAPPRTEHYGPASILTQLFADVRPIAILPPTVFWPRPQVESLMLTIRPQGRPERSRPARAEERPGGRDARELPVSARPAFAAFVQRAFQQRRKMLRRLFREWDEARLQLAFGRAGVSPEARPEELSPSAWQSLYAAMCGER